MTGCRQRRGSTNGGAFLPATIASIDPGGAAHRTATVPLPFENVTPILVEVEGPAGQADEFVAIPVIVFNKLYQTMAIEIAPQINLLGERIAFTPAPDRPVRPAVQQRAGKPGGA